MKEVYEKVVFNFENRNVPVSTLLRDSCNHYLEHSHWKSTPIGGHLGYISYHAFECKKCEKFYYRILTIGFEDVEYFADSTGVIKRIDSDPEGYEEVKRQNMRKQLFSEIFNVAVEGGLISTEEAERMEKATRKKSD